MVGLAFSIRRFVLAPTDPDGIQPNFLWRFGGVHFGLSWLTAVCGVTVLIVPYVPWYAARIFMILLAMALGSWVIHASLSRFAKKNPSSEISFKRFMTSMIYRADRRLRVQVTKLRRAMVPEDVGWEELKAPLLNKLSNFGSRHLFKLYWYLVIAAVIAVVGLVIFVVTFEPSPAYIVMRAIVAYNAFLLSSFLAVLLVCYLGFIAVFRGSKTELVGARTRHQVRLAAEYAGLGTFIGIMLALLMPLLSVVEVIEYPITPESLITMGALGAIVGSVYGLLVIVAKVVDGFRNLIIRNLLCPLGFIILAWAFVPLIGPRSIHAKGVAVEVDRSSFDNQLCSTTNIDKMQELAGQGMQRLVVFGEECGHAVIISNDAIFLMIVFFVLVMTGINGYGSIKKRMSEQVV